MRLSAPCADLARVVLLVLVGALVAAPVARAQTPQVTRGPYLQMVSETAATIRWRTQGNPSSSRVRYGTNLSDLSLSIVDPARVEEHEIRLNGLSPGTRYYYAVGTAEEDIVGGDGSHYLVTHPPRGEPAPVRIWVVGDSGQCSLTEEGCNDVAAVRDAYLTFAGGRQADVWLMLGDIAYTHGRDHEFQHALFEPFPMLLRRLAPWPTIGNHDLPRPNSVYLDVFSLPESAEAGGIASGTERYYSFDYGAVHFVVLDSYTSDRSVDGPMYTWLQQDLAASDADWTLAYWHHSPYSRGSHDSNVELPLIEMRENFVPLLEAFGVDLQLSGHSHSYERSVLLDGHYGTSDTYEPDVHAVDAGDGDPAGDGSYAKPIFVSGSHEGAVYGVVGSSSKLSVAPLDHPVMEVSLLALGSMVVDIDGDVLEGWFIDDAGAVRDRFRIEKGGVLACNNGIDDDGDGFRDHAEDRGCTSLEDDSELLYSEDFQGVAPGDDPVDWVDTAADYSLDPDDTAFAVRDAGGGERTFASTGGADVHSHWIGPGSATGTSYEVSGRMRLENLARGIGVTILSGYPSEDAYYRLRSWFGNSFQLTARGTSITGGTTDTGVEPQAGVWYRFRVQANGAAGGRTELRARVWQDGTPEPEVWQAEAWDAGPDRRIAGRFGLWSFRSGLKEWDDLSLDFLQPRPPRCNDGVDNDGDGLIDWDGGGAGSPDPQCGAPWYDGESYGCGMTPEIAPVLLLWLCLRTRRRAARRI